MHCALWPKQNIREQHKQSKELPSDNHHRQAHSYIMIFPIMHSYLVSPNQPLSLTDPRGQSSSVSIDGLAMQAAAASAPAPRHRVYTAVEPRCEWARTADADTLVVDVSGFMKEELKVLYNTSRKLKVAGERPVGDGGGGARWARFLKSFPVPKSVRTGGIRAVMDKDQAVLYVILPKGSPPPPPPPPPPSSAMATQKDQQPGGALPPPHGERKGDGSSGSSSNGSFWSAQEDAGKNRDEEKKMAPKETRIRIQEEEEEIAAPDAPRTDGGSDANAVEKDGGDGDDGKRWWEKMKLRPLHVVGFDVLVLAVVGIGALYAMLLL